MHHARASVALAVSLGAALNLGCDAASPSTLVELDPSADASADRAAVTSDSAIDASLIDAPSRDVASTDATATDSTAMDAPRTPLAPVIQVAIQQECREGGVKFTVIPTSPFRGADGYSFMWVRTMGAASFTTANNALVAANAPPPGYAGYPVHFDVTIRRPGYPDRTVSDVWSNPCNHDDNPTECPENARDLVTNQESYAVGDTFDARLVGTTQTVHAPWYVLDGLSDATFSEEGRHVVARVTSLPVHVHAQPDSVVGMAVCHGWTERWFYAP